MRPEVVAIAVAWLAGLILVGCGIARVARRNQGRRLDELQQRYALKRCVDRARRDAQQQERDDRRADEIARFG